MQKAEEYNYKRFKPSIYDFLNFPGPKAGEKFIDFKVTTLEGKKVRLSEFIGKTIVLETGSVTCPNYVQDIDAMQRLIKKYQDIQFILLYVREAHPGSETPNHRTITEKYKQARRLYEEYNENRLILIDDIRGLAHQKYGSMPNMIYVINQEGTVVFRSDWNNIETLSHVLADEEHKNLYYNEHFEPVIPNFWIMIQVLLKGGWSALIDMALAFPTLQKLHQKANIAYANRRAV